MACRVVAGHARLAAVKEHAGRVDDTLAVVGPVEALGVPVGLVVLVGAALLDVSILLSAEVTGDWTVLSHPPSVGHTVTPQSPLVAFAVLVVILAGGRRRGRLCPTLLTRLPTAVVHVARVLLALALGGPDVALPAVVLVVAAFVDGERSVTSVMAAVFTNTSAVLVQDSICATLVLIRALGSTLVHFIDNGNIIPSQLLQINATYFVFSVFVLGENCLFLLW